jgi:tryptophanyl-tRNA synthetase
MSKSYGNTIALMAEPAATARSIRRIVTDSTPPKRAKDPDACTLVALLRAFADAGTVSDVERRYRDGGIGYGEVKALLTGAVEDHVAPLRRRYERLLADPSLVEARLAEGERHAAVRAGGVLGRAMAAVGL